MVAILSRLGRRKTPSLEVSIEFTDVSRDKLSLPEAVRFAQEQGGILQSAQEAAVFRYEDYRRGTREFTDQLTRTVAAYFETNGNYVVAFDDAPDKASNLILSRSMEGISESGWFLPFYDRDLRALLLRATESGCIIILDKQEEIQDPWNISLRLKDWKNWDNRIARYRLDVGLDGKSEYGRSRLVGGILNSFAENYALFLRSLTRGETGYGRVRHLRHSVFGENRRKAREDGAVINFVLLEGEGTINACGNFFDIMAYARGVKYSVKEAAKWIFFIILVLAAVMKN